MNYILFLKAFQSKYSGINDKQMLFQYLREELQYLILHVLYSKMNYSIYFMGGTKLRLSYGLNRFSEDIDMALDKPDKNFPAEKFHSEIAKAFSAKVTGFQFQSKLSAKRNVVKVMLSFGQILFDIGFTPLKDQTIKIKIEIDTNPPAGAAYEKKTYRSMVGDYIVNTYDLSTGFAGKLSAVLFREYQKGRDYYDLQWYLQRKPSIPINFEYLNANTIQQGKEKFKNEKEIIEAITKKIKAIDFPLMKQDIERFIVMDSRSFSQWLENYIPETLDLLQTYQTAHESR